jgi:hypothetical protein
VRRGVEWAEGEHGRLRGREGGREGEGGEREE